jgi:hypothetical protein
MNEQLKANVCMLLFHAAIAELIPNSFIAHMVIDAG